MEGQKDNQDPPPRPLARHLSDADRLRKVIQELMDTEKSYVKVKKKAWLTCLWGWLWLVYSLNVFSSYLYTSSLPQGPWPTKSPYLIVPVVSGRLAPVAEAAGFDVVALVVVNL